MEIEFKLSGTHVEDFARKVRVFGTQARLEMARGLNDAGDRVRTQVRRALKDQMGVDNYGVVVDATSSIPARFNEDNNLVYKITATGKGLPIRMFGAQVDGSGAIEAMPWGRRHEFKRSFKTTRKGRFLARRSEQRLPVRALYGPSPAKELVKDQSLATFQAAVPAIVEPIVMQRLIRLMP